MNENSEYSSKNEKSLREREKKFKSYFKSCDVSTLEDKTTHLVSVAINLVNYNKYAANDALELAVKAGATSEELNRVACLCACTSGIKVQDLYFDILRNSKVLNRESAQLFKDISVPEDFTYASIDRPSVLESESLCSSKSLDSKTERLVSLAACLASSCRCTTDHLIEARTAEISKEEITRVVCMAACACGFKIIDEYESHLRRVTNN